MKKLAILLAVAFAAANCAYAAATTEDMAAQLEKAGFTVPANGGHQAVTPPAHPQPVNVGHQQPGHPQNPGNTHNDHNQPGNGHNQPWDDHGNNYPTYPPVHPPYPPVHPPYPPVQMQTFRFESGAFVFSSDASRSMEDAAASLQRAGYLVLEKRSNYTTYTLVFQAPSYMKTGKFTSGTFVFSSEAKKAADECAAAMKAQGKLILEKNVSGTQFVISYLEKQGHGGYQETQTYTSGNFVFSSDAAKSMNETAAALQSIGAIILEKRQNGTSYTIVFQAQFRMETQNYASGNFVFSSDAARSMNETVAALQSVRSVVVLEKRQSGTSYNVVFLAPFPLQPQKYVSGSYTFSSDAQKAANETAEAFVSQGMVVLEKNVAGTQFTITYFRPYYY